MLGSCIEVLWGGGKAERRVVGFLKPEGMEELVITWEMQGTSAPTQHTLMEQDLPGTDP